MDGRVILIAALCAGIYFGGHEVVKVSKKAGHAIVHVFKKQLKK